MRNSFIFSIYKIHCVKAGIYMTKFMQLSKSYSYFSPIKK